MGEFIVAAAAAFTRGRGLSASPTLRCAWCAPRIVAFTSRLLVLTTNVPRRHPPRRADFGLSQPQLHPGAPSPLPKQRPLLEPDVSPLWASPEALLGEAQRAPSDAFSFASVLWECLARELPFAREATPWEINARVVAGMRPSFDRVEWREGLADDGSERRLRDALARAWSLEPSARPTVAQLIDEVDAVLSSRVLAQPTSRERADALRRGAATRVRRAYEIGYDELEMGAELARGAFGAVHRAQWRGTTVAVKVQLASTLGEKELGAYLAELDFTAALRHPHVVMLLAACLEVPRLCIVLEFASNGALDGILYGKEAGRVGGVALQTPLLLRMALSIARGLAFLHSSDPPFMHRDMKPANCFVFEDPAVVKIGDFGMSRFKDASATMTQCGTPLYIAPEVFAGKHYGESIDVYAFGLMLFELLARQRPMVDHFRRLGRQGFYKAVQAGVCVRRVDSRRALRS